MNQNGDLLLDMCLQNKVAACNKFLKKRVIHKMTWLQGLKGEVVASSSVEYIRVSSEVNALVLDLTVGRPAGDGQPDHHLAVGWVLVLYEWSPPTQEEVKTLVKLRDCRIKRRR